MVYLFIAEGFEEIEAVTVCDILRRGGVDVRTVSLAGDIVKGAHGIGVEADMDISEADIEQCEMAVLPGGMPGTTNLMASDRLCGLLLEMSKRDDKRIAAICAAPMVLAKLGILDGKRAVIYPGMESELGSAKAGHGSVVIDGNIITSKAPGTAMPFALMLLTLLKGEETAAEVGEGLVY